MNLQYIQLEINGHCPFDCPSCLPKPLKTGVMMTPADVRLIINQAKEAHVKYVALAGFGSPVDHPHYEEIAGALSAPFQVSVTCRAFDVLRAARTAKVIVSVQSVEDAKTLVEKARELRKSDEKTALLPHIVLYHGLASSIAMILNVLCAWEGYWESITIAQPIALCEDQAHVDFIGESVIRTGMTWSAAWNAIVDTIPNRKVGINVYDAMPRSGRCTWLQGGLYVNARLDVLPCCYRPAVKPIANLRETTLAELAGSEPHAAFEKECTLCPNFIDP